MYLPMARTQESWGKHFKMDDDGLPMIPELGLGHGHIIYRRNALYVYIHIYKILYTSHLQTCIIYYKKYEKESHSMFFSMYPLVI